MKARKHSAAISFVVIVLSIMITCFVIAQPLPDPHEGCTYLHAKNQPENSFSGFRQFDRIDIYIDPMNDANLNACGIHQYPARIKEIVFPLLSYEYQGSSATLDYTLSFSYPKNDDDPCSGIEPFYTTEVQTTRIGTGVVDLTYKPDRSIVVTKPFFVSLRLGYFSGYNMPSIRWETSTFALCRQFFATLDYNYEFVVNDFAESGLGNTGNIDVRVLLSDDIPSDNGTIPEITFGDDLQDRMIAVYDGTTYNGTQYSQARVERFDEDDSIKTYIDCGFAFPGEYNRFPKPMIKDDIVGAAYTLDSVDVVRGITSVVRTCTAIDQAGHRSKPFRFIIEYNGETHQIELSDLSRDGTSTTMAEFNEDTVPLGVENTFRITAQNACADAVLVQWFVDKTLIQGQEGTTVKYTWNKPGKYRFGAAGLGALRKSVDTFEITVIVKGPEFTTTSKNVSCFGGADGSIVLNPVKDVKLIKWSTGATSLKIQNLKAGTYYVDAWDFEDRTVREEITITEPAKVEADIASTDELCEGKCNGSLTASNLRGGTPPYTGYWQNVVTKDKYPVLSKSDACVGQFKFIVQDKNKCPAQDYIKEILKGDPIPVANFTSSGDNSGIIYTFTNLSTNAASYSWNMGDGTTLSSVTFPTFTYTYKTNGVFTVVLTASSTHKCENKMERDVEITRVVGVEDILQSLGMEIYPNPSFTTLTLDNEHGVALEKVTLSSIQGQDLISVEGSALRQNSVDIDVKHLRQGMYILTIRVDENHTWHKRIMIIH